MHKQTIIVKGHAGLTHMLCTTTYALNLSEEINNIGLECEIFHDWINFKSFNQVFEVQHKNFLKNNPYAFNHKDVLHAKKIDILKLKENIKPILVDASCTAAINNITQTYKLSDEVFKKFKCNYLSLNEGNYAAIHVRGSDRIEGKYASYSCFLEEKTKNIEKQIEEHKNKNLITLLCSDNQDILRVFVNNKSVFSFSLPYELHQKNINFPHTDTLHKNHNKYFKYFNDFDLNSNAAIDLYLLIHAKVLHADLNSGFGQIAATQNKKLLNFPNLRII